MNDQELAKLAQVVRDASLQGTNEALRRAGIDVDDLRASQADMLFLRQSRKSAEAMKGKVITVFLTATVGGLLAALWVGIKGSVR